MTEHAERVENLVDLTTSVDSNSVRKDSEPVSSVRKSESPPESPNKYPQVDLARDKVVDGSRNKKTHESLVRDILRGGGVLVKGERIEVWYDPRQGWDKQGLEEPQQTITVAFSNLASVAMTEPIVLDDSSAGSTPVVGSGQISPKETVSKPAAGNASSASTNSSAKKSSKVGGKAAVVAVAKTTDTSPARWIKGSVVSSNKGRYTVTVELDHAIPKGSKKVKLLVVHAKVCRWKLVQSVDYFYSGRVYQPRADQKPLSGNVETVDNEKVSCELVFSDMDAKVVDMNETKKEFFRVRKNDPAFKKTYAFKYSVPPAEQAEMDSLKKLERESAQSLAKELKERSEVLEKEMGALLSSLDEKWREQSAPLSSKLAALKSEIDTERDTQLLCLESTEGRVSATGQSIRVLRKQIEDSHRNRTVKELYPVEKQFEAIQSVYDKNRREIQSRVRNEVFALSEKKEQFVQSIRDRQLVLKNRWKQLSENDVNAMRVSQTIRLEKEWFGLRGIFFGKSEKNFEKPCCICKLTPGWSCQENKCDDCYKFGIYERKMEDLELRVPWANNKPVSEFTAYHVFFNERSRELRPTNAEPAVISQLCREAWKKVKESEKQQYEVKRQHQLLELVENLEEEAEEEDLTGLTSAETNSKSVKRGLANVSGSSAITMSDLSSDDDGDSISDEACVKCLSLKHPEVMLQCDRQEGEKIDADNRVCGGMLHTYCCDPALQEVPKGEWFCSSLCAWVEHHKPIRRGGSSSAATTNKENIWKGRKSADKSKIGIAELAALIGDEEDAGGTSKSLHHNALSDLVKLDIALGKKNRMEFLLAEWDRISPFLGNEADKVKSSIAHKLATLSQQLISQMGISSSAIGLREKIINFGGESAFPIATTPGYVEADMRPYQLDGLNWFISQHDKGANSIMADEMGLGKTLQTLSFLATLKEYVPFFSPFLVVCPLSVLPNWIAEAKRWTPQLTVVGLFGPQSERERIKQNFDKQNTNLIVTTYEILLTEVTWLRSQFYFRYFVLDEAQKIKNTEALVTQACRQIRSVYRVLLTGTPLQNNMKELWSLLNFLYPEIFNLQTNSVTQFAQAYDSTTSTDDTSAVMIKNDAFMKQCQTLLEPIMIRRLKQNVLAALLPPKTEIVLTAPLSLVQQFHYKQVLKTVTGMVRNMGYKNVSSLLWQLWKCCLHPYLFEGVETVGENDTHTVDNKIVWMSGKMCLLDSLLGKLFEDRSKCLIYSQYTSMLDIIEEYCQWRGWRYLRLDGSTSLARRRFYMHLFNRPVPAGSISSEEFQKNHYFVFLVSTKAGGVGVNLQSANSVILYDSSWNPFVDAQAEDRAHRMGQKKEVTVYRLITKDTCEERIRFFAQQKLKMKEHVLGEDASGEKKVLEVGDNEDLPYSADQLRDILEFGADKWQASSDDDAREDRLNDPIVGEKFYQHCCASLEEQLKAAEILKMKPVVSDGVASKSASNPTAQLSPVKRNICIRKFADEDYTQTKLERTTEMDWLDKMEEEKVTVRNRKATTVTVHEKGVGNIQISKWSLEQEEKEQEQAEREKARIEAKKLGGTKKFAQHDMNCIHCHESVLKQRVIVTTEIDQDGNQVKRRKIDSDNSGYITCPICPASLHSQCAKLAIFGDEYWNSNRISCPQHKCRLCRRSASNAGGLLFRCVDCPIALCYDCIETYGLVNQFQFIERDQAKWETSCGYNAPGTYEYMHCPDCFWKSQAKPEKLSDSILNQTSKTE